MSVSIAAHSWAGRQTKARVQPTKCIFTTKYISNMNLQEIYVCQIYISARNIYIKDVPNIRLGKQTKTQKRGFNQPGEKFNRLQT